METIDSATYQRLLAREKQKEAADAATKKTRRKPRHLESCLQRQCVTTFRFYYPQYRLLLFAVPNGGHRSAIEASIMQAEGVTPGVADLLLLVARGQHHGLCIEMKTDSKKSGQSDKQREWQAAVEAAGYKYVVVRSLPEFERLVQDYLDEEGRGCVK